jgi:hypothetical protein
MILFLLAAVAGVVLAISITFTDKHPPENS